MFHSRKLHHKINKIQERALKLIYQDYEFSYEVLMEKERSMAVHQRNLQFLMIEMFKTKNGLNPAFMREIFCEPTNEYILRSSGTVTYGSENIRYRGPQVWATIPHSI